MIQYRDMAGKYELPILTPMSEVLYRELLGDATMPFSERQATFEAAQPVTTERIILTDHGLWEGATRFKVRDMIFEDTPQKSLYAGLSGHAVLRSGQLIDSEDESQQRFSRSFWASSRERWQELGGVGDDNPMKYALIKGGDYPAFAVYDPTKVEWTGDPWFPEKLRTNWRPRESFSTELALVALYHVVSLDKLVRPTD